MLSRGDEVSWPKGLEGRTVCFGLDVEWAPPEILADTIALFDRYGIATTFFVTHDDVAVPGHERALHPNFRRNGDTYKRLPDAASKTDDEVNRHVIDATLAFAPEAKGVRAHGLRYDSGLLPLYRAAGIEYECSYRIPLVSGLRPFWNQHDLVSIPSYYGDYFDLLTGATRFACERLQLEREGIKVLDFHPVLIFINAPNEQFYLERKPYYRDVERLLASRHDGLGVRTLLVDVLEKIAAERIATKTLGELNALWRTTTPWC